MHIVNIHEAKTQLSKLIEYVIAGKEVIIAKSGKPVARLEPIHGGLKKRIGGQWKGKIKIADDFDELPEDILAAFLGKSDEPAP
ncbi:type II toxin-antitoxin system Phd/YefM family antitoxin [Bacteroidota bacterium]